MTHLPNLECAKSRHLNTQMTAAISVFVLLFIATLDGQLAEARPPTQPSTRPGRTQLVANEDVNWRQIEPAASPQISMNANQLSRQQLSPSFPPRPSQPQQAPQQQVFSPQQHQFGPMASNKFPLSQQQQTQNNPYTNATHAILLDLRQQLITRAMKFDEHFRGLLTQSKLSLHNMFMTTYGMMYEHNTEIFTSMYESLEQYYATGGVELTKSMESFFQRLYQKIFQVANSNRAFSSNYLECVSEQMTILKPFKDAPDKLIVDIRHALVAARTFNQALNSAIDMIKSIISLGDPPQCIKLISEKLLKNQQQPVGGSTRELPGSLVPPVFNTKQPPCLNFCEQVIMRCVGRANLEPLADRWRSYVQALAELAKKLSVQYNIETIIGPIDVQISEAIMNFQDNSHNITERVYAACGDAKPNNGLQPATLSNVAPMRAPIHNMLGKREAVSPRLSQISGSNPATFGYHRQQQSIQSTRRHLQPASAHQEGGAPQAMLSPNSGYDRGPSSPRMLTSTSTNLVAGDHQRSSGLHGPTSSLYDSYEDSSLTLPHFNRKSPAMIGDIRDYLLSTKNFWTNLPSSVCNVSLGANISTNMYQRRPQLQQNCFHETLEVYDMNSDLRYRIEIQHQVQRLDNMYARITDALHGVEIDWSKVDAAGGIPVDPLQQTQSQTSRPPQGVVNQPARPSIATQPVNGGKPTPVSDEEEDSEELIEEDETGSGGNIEDSDDLHSSASDDDDDIEHEDDTTDASDDLSLTTQTTDQSSDNPIPALPDNSIENDDKQMNLNQSNDLITADPSPRKSGAGNSESLIVINRWSLLLVSTMYCALSVVIQSHFQLSTNNRASD